MKDISVTIKGFKSAKQAKTFFEWFVGRGEQVLFEWFDINEVESVTTDLNKKHKIDKHGNVIFWVQ